MNPMLKKTIIRDVEPEAIPEIASNSDKLAEYVIDNSRNASIILLHVMYKVREALLESLHQIIEGLKKKGFEFKTVSEMLKYIEHQ